MYKSQLLCSTHRFIICKKCCKKNHWRWEICKIVQNPSCDFIHLQLVTPVSWLNSVLVAITGMPRIAMVPPRLITVLVTWSWMASTWEIVWRSYVGWSVEWIRCRCSQKLPVAFSASAAWVYRESGVDVKQEAVCHAETQPDRQTHRHTHTDTALVD